MITVGVFFLGTFSAYLKEVCVMSEEGKVIKIPSSVYGLFNYDSSDHDVKHILQKRMNAFNAGIRH